VKCGRVRQTGSQAHRQTDIKTDTQTLTAVVNIHFTSAMPRAKCSNHKKLKPDLVASYDLCSLKTEPVLFYSVQLPASRAHTGPFPQRLRRYGNGSIRLQTWSQTWSQTCSELEFGLSLTILPATSKLARASRSATSSPAGRKPGFRSVADRFELSRHVEIARTWSQTGSQLVCDLLASSC